MLGLRPDLATILVRDGMAWAFVRCSSDYVLEKEDARTACWAFMFTAACWRTSDRGNETGSNPDL